MGITIPNTPGNDDHAPKPTALPSPPGADADALEIALRDMSDAFLRDVVAGRMGQRHNTYAHRSRILRQLDAQLSAMRGATSDGAG